MTGCEVVQQKSPRGAPTGGAKDCSPYLVRSSEVSICLRTCIGTMNRMVVRRVSLSSSGGEGWGEEAHVKFICGLPESAGWFMESA